MYTAPEILEGKDYNLSSDIYSLGCVIYEAIYGNAPFKFSSKNDLLYQIKNH